jgi:hypothetical protein
VPLIVKYRFKDHSSPEFYLVAIPNPDYDPSEKRGKGDRNFHLFATNVEFASAEEFIRWVPEEYRKRWDIETGYRIKNEFRIRTCSRSPVTRTFLFVLQCILHNYLNTLKCELYMTAYQLKSTIGDGVLSLLKGLKAPRMSLREFFVRVGGYNLQRIWELRYALTII